jgi:pilus assembly protein CpaB
MRRPNIKIPSYVLLIGIALILGIGTAYLVLHTLQSREAAITKSLLAKEHAGKVDVVVPTRDLKPGDRASADDMAERLIPKSVIYPSTVTAEEWAEFAGRTLTHRVYKGKPMLTMDFAPAGPQSFASRLHPGERAITITASGTNGIAGFLVPGNRVDVMLLGHGPGGSQEMPLLHRARILATGHMDHALPANAPQSVPVSARGYDTLTLALTPTQAARLALAEQVGHLRIVLVPNRHPDRGPVPHLYAADLFGTPPASPPKTTGVQFIIGGGNGSSLSEQPLIPEAALPMTAPAHTSASRISQRELQALHALVRATAPLQSQETP